MRSVLAVFLALALGGCVTGNVVTDLSAPSHVQEALKYRGRGNVTGFRGPWCRAFVNMSLRNSGHHLTDTSLRAKDAVNLGHRVDSLVAGAIFVMPHHTGFVWRVTGPNTFESVEGNHGHRVQTVMRSTRGLVLIIPN